MCRQFNSGSRHCSTSRVHSVKSPAAGLLFVAMLAGVGACDEPPSERLQCLDELTRFFGEIQDSSHPIPAAVSIRLAELRKSPAANLTHQELAWILVSALRIDYRLRHGSGPEACQELLEDIGLMRSSSGTDPVSVDELRHIVSRSALPETEIVAPEPCPLPGWLWEPS